MKKEKSELEEKLEYAKNRYNEACEKADYRLEEEDKRYKEMDKLYTKLSKYED